jgi:hypothetical protein
MRKHMKRFARLTAGHSKKIENHVHMDALYATWYNFARIDRAVRMSPAMAPVSWIACRTLAISLN